ncbi:MAG: SPOR domain-containing protein [bacterium]
MKNINLAPHSSVPLKGGHGNKPFIILSIIVLAFLSFACLYIYISSDNQWQNDFGAKIGSFFDFEKPKKWLRLSDSKKDSEEKKHFEPHANGREYVDNSVIEEIEEEKSVLEKTDIQTAGIGVEENVKPTETRIAAGQLEEKTISVKGEEKVVPVETEKETLLTEAESSPEPAEKEKPKLLENDSNKDSHYYIQVCSCVIKDNADKIFRRLGDHGYSPVMEEIVRQIKMHNIYTDDFAKKSDALELLNRLKKNGFDSALLPSSGGGYKIRITSCFYVESAKGIIKRLNRLGYETSIRKEFMPTRMYSVLLGDFSNLKEAEAASDRLVKLGYPKPILKLNPET